MIFILSLFLILYLFVLLLFKKSVLLHTKIDTEKNIYSLDFYWLSPFISVNVKAMDYRPTVSLYFFRKKIFSKILKSKRKGKRNFIHYLRKIYFYDSNLEAFYGFNNPFSTGITSGIVVMLQSFIPDMPVYAVPDFIADHDYCVMRGDAKINLGKTFLRFLNLKIKNRSEKYGTVKYN